MTEVETELVEAGPLPRKRGLILAVAALLVYAADLVTKVIVTATLEGEAPIRLLGGAVYLQLVRNPGAAFSMATGMTWLFTLIAAGVVVAIIWIVPKLRSTGWALGLGLVLAGAMGNLTDRIFRAPAVFQGHVVDFVSVFAPNGDFFPLFNVADAGISVGGVLIVLMALLGRDYDGTIARKTRKGEDA
ncbi:signal peptidase II [Actinokineospora diospyrosa]|uniref:Lipoprotein signal peptidase n=1 Tax=Actinokineospora diospyrosa TaxID=103728 RepID=A0ABT1IJT8_9PSEU|nr:signal peptidase II [Actinokineospora diospyrosa]MCP2272921.1 signal peptidase II [Actinokineospora diospyrosa]